jgi:hypothetical protein
MEAGVPFVSRYVCPVSDPARHVPGAGHDTVVRLPPGTTLMGLDHDPTGDGCVVVVVVLDVDALAAWLDGDEVQDAVSNPTAMAASASFARPPRTRGSRGPLPRPGAETMCRGR